MGDLLQKKNTARWISPVTNITSTPEKFLAREACSSVTRAFTGIWLCVRIPESRGKEGA